jgi:hypothetical protein
MNPAMLSITLETIHKANIPEKLLAAPLPPTRYPPSLKPAGRNHSPLATSNSIDLGAISANGAIPLRNPRYQPPTLGHLSTPFLTQVST